MEGRERDAGEVTTKPSSCFAPSGEQDVVVSCFPLQQRVQIAPVLMGWTGASQREACDTGITMQCVPVPWASGELALWQRICDFPMAVTGSISPCAFRCLCLGLLFHSGKAKVALDGLHFLRWLVLTCGARGWVGRGCKARGLQPWICCVTLTPPFLGGRRGGRYEGGWIVLPPSILWLLWSLCSSVCPWGTSPASLPQWQRGGLGGLKDIAVSAPSVEFSMQPESMEALFVSDES